MATKSAQRTLKVLKDLGYDCGVVEHWNPYAKQRKDLFDFIDIIAITDEGVVAVQACDSSFKAHDRKILNNKYAKRWIKTNPIQLWGWRKVKKKRGGKMMVWKPRFKKYKEEDFE